MVERDDETQNQPPRAGTSAEQWRAELAAWRIDDEILEAAPESPYRLPPGLFRAGPDDPARRPHALAREALPVGGTVLDVGCGAGAGSLLLAPPAAHLLGVDESEEMLAAYTSAAGERGIDVTAYRGRWPDIAPEVPLVDVVVSHHVVYNVPDLAAFARALHEHARFRVVVELTPTHPWTPIGPLWQRFHGQPRPSGPTAELAAAVLAESGIAATLEYAPDRPRPAVPDAERVRHLGRRLCLPADRDDEVAAALAEAPVQPNTTVAVLWWDVG